MTDDLRRAVAYIVARLARSQDVSAVYDTTAGRYFQFSGEVTSSRVDVYDYSRGCHLDGTPPSLFDGGAGAFLDLMDRGSKFEGYDYETGAFYEAAVSGSTVSVYDFGTGSEFEYSV